MKKKVLIQSPNLYVPGGNGRKNYYRSIKDYLESDITFFFYGAQGKKESKLGAVKRLIGDYIRFYRELRKGGYDLVHINPSLNFRSFFRDSGFALISNLLNYKTITFWRGWDVDFERKIVRKILPYFRLTYGKSESMILLAQEFLDQIRSYGYEKPIYLETTVVNDAILNFKKNQANGEKPGAEKETALLFLARMEKVKGIYETIDSFQRLQQKYPHLVLNIAGTGGELDQVRQYVADKGVQKVNFLGWVSGEQKAEVLHQADIYVLASYHGEGMPNSILEAMASRLSIVTTNAGGVKDFFQEGKMGFYVRPKDTDDLEAKLDRLLSDPEKMEEIGEFNTAYARQRFSSPKVAKRLEQIYEKTHSGGMHGQLQSAGL